MNNAFKHIEHEVKLVSLWQNKLTSYISNIRSKKGESFSIALPPPNANASLHAGHACFVYEDIMIRHAMLSGKKTLWIPGSDHAGFETQFVYEKHLDKMGKSRFDYTQEELYRNIYDFVQENKGLIQTQLTNLGFLLPWEKQQFTLDPNIVMIVYETFKKLYKEGYIYRAKRLVNFCFKSGTSFSDLEVEYKQKEGELFYITYPIKSSSDTITVATTRPETLLGDTAVAVNPKDTRYSHLVGKTIILPITSRQIPIIADDMVEMEFGTGAVKITPAHDAADYETGLRHNLPQIDVFTFTAKIAEGFGELSGMNINKARELIITQLTETGALTKREKYVHNVPVSYKGGYAIEPMLKEQWFVKVAPLVKPVIEAIEKNQITFTPKRSKDMALQWLNNFRDWNISRQIVWGIQIPAFYNEIKKEWVIENDSEKQKELTQNGFVQDTDTFDTWFSSSQWPYATLLATEGLTLNDISKEGTFFSQFYPNNVMETGYDILPWWVCRMLFMGNFATGKMPFKHIFLHGLVKDGKGQKMSKSKGNVVNPGEITEKYGSDALRAALVFQVAEGADVSLSDDKVKGMRNFGNKLWNMARFIKLSDEFKVSESDEEPKNLDQTMSELQKEYAELKKLHESNMQNYKYGVTLEALHDFTWHRFADYYIEELKVPLKKGDKKVKALLQDIFLDCLVMLHPFIPFVTDAIWSEFQGEGETIISFV
jgi:valyl-tRNA synthetase